MSYSEDHWETDWEPTDHNGQPRFEWPFEDDQDLEPEDETCTLVFQVPTDEILQQDPRLLAGQIGCVALSVFRRVADSKRP